jgi:PAS domain S-box-containing protein
MKASRSLPKTDQKDLILLKEQIKALGKALRASQKKSNQFFNLIEKAHDIIYETDISGHLSFVNQVTEMITGYSKEELIGEHYLKLVSPDFQMEAARFYGKQFINKIRNTYFEFPLISRTGGRIWVGQHVQLLIRGDDPYNPFTYTRIHEYRESKRQKSGSRIHQSNLNYFWARHHLLSIKEPFLLKGLSQPGQYLLKIIRQFGDTSNPLPGNGMRQGNLFGVKEKAV